MMPRRDEAGAETVGALVLFGIFVGVLAFLNVTAVPQAGLEAEEQHYLDTLGALNALQASAEAAALPGGAGTTVSEALVLGPSRSADGGFFGAFVAEPAQAAGELRFNASYGNVSLQHTEAGSGAAIYDLGGPALRLPLGQLVFEPNAIFRPEGAVSVENGAIITNDGGTQTLRHAPAITLAQADGVTQLVVKTRLLNGTSASLGGTGPARVALHTEATTLSAPAAANAQNATLRLETAHGRAWGAYLNSTSQAAGLAPGVGYSTSVQRGAGLHGLDVVTWRVEGTGAGNDVRLTTGLALQGVGLS